MENFNDIKEQTLAVEVRDQDIEKFRKAIKVFQQTDWIKQKYDMIVFEKKSENLKGIIFLITSNNPYVFYKIGFNFGTIKQFNT